MSVLVFELLHSSVDTYGRCSVDWFAPLSSEVVPLSNVVAVPYEEDEYEYK